MAAVATAQPDAAKVFAAIAAIMSRRDGRRVKVVSITKTEKADEAQKKAG